jgi:type IV pilus assembly protein PilA
MAPYKLAVDAAWSDQGQPTSFTGFDAGSIGIPAAVTGNTTGALAAVTTATGIVTATPRAFKGIVAADTCTLTPTVNNTAARLDWAYSGACLTKGYVKN